MDMFHYGHGWGTGFGMWFFPLLFWILVIAAVVFLVRVFVPKNSQNYPPPPDNESPKTILQKRYAKGEIDEETYKRMKKELDD